MELNLPRGMRDYPPEEKIRRDELVKLLINVFESYGFSPLETPIAERWEVLAAKYSGGAEILQETFKLTDQGGRELGLRYDLTVPLARFIGQNPTIKRPFKRYQIGPVFRDGPIRKGRTRQFIQCDVDIVGSSSMLADAECINLALDVFEKLRFRVIVRINNRKILYDIIGQVGAILRDRPSLPDDEIILTLDKLEKVGRGGVLQELTDKGLAGDVASRLLKGFDQLSEKSNAETLGKLHELLGPSSESVAALESVLQYVKAPERVKIVPSLARGLSYYTGTIFEVYSLDPTFDSSIAAGGRYDRLISDFLATDQPYPAVGISFGLEPIMELLKANKESEALTVTELYVIPIGTVKECLVLVHQLRSSGIKTDLSLTGRGISDGLKYANAYRIPYALIVGTDELQIGVVKLRDMKSGEETLLKLQEVIARLRPNQEKPV
jgi:histidyl-tRNA synthetase